MDSYGYEVDVFTRVDDMRTMAAAWDVLAERFGSPLLGADWFLSCAETLCAESDLRVVVVRSKNAICAVAPLVVVRRGGIEWLELLGVSVLYEPAGLLYDGVESLQHLVHKVVSFRMPMVLARIPAESPIEATFRALTGYRGMVISRKTASAAYVCIKGSWEDYFQSISGQRRYDYQRKRKRIERLGQAVVRVECPSSRADLPLLLEEAFRIEGAGWKARSGSALLANERVRTFITRYSEMACDRGALRVCFLEVQGRPIATILGIQVAQRFWVLKIGYDEEWARCSPGIQLTMETIRYAFEQGLEAYEFLGSEEPWQAMWPRHRHVLTSLVLYPTSLQGLLSFSEDLHQFAMRRAQQMFRSFAKRMDRHVTES
ncbi:MAG: GNAT family N-acetyltransferase [Nitrospirota bacterium]|nr:GNAT family N-acetyltransferase [Nitrospirota bacterium]MDP2382720.1 GNAT family N-acetyltransferase [Nitrospirota bacterium]